jgi:hypothetical protein
MMDAGFIAFTIMDALFTLPIAAAKQYQVSLTQRLSLTK